MAFHSPEKIIELARDAGVKKAKLPFSNAMILGFLAGAYIALGFLLYIRVSANFPIHIWGALPSIIGASLFPLGLILVIIAGGELLTGNMMAVTLAKLSGKITTWQITKNWIIATISNFIGSVFVAYFFGHLLGLTETGPYLERTITVAENKINEPFHLAFISGIGANWLVCLAVWLAYAAKDTAGKIIGIWFPIMAFVAIGFQHVVANMFIIPAAIFAGSFNWLVYFENFIAVFLGNAIGGAIFVASFYWVAYGKNEERV
ncbi:formate/nitrite transporter family protein [Bacillus niameyensis]|uniref:formate/nitrite transporter family protein n=1 Tax=Bacillus niameyensis TaxID=1522308 RepID=UPI00078564FE|nr:formate/nitrite transporter family protein [Bacillus niameyensis]